MCNFICFGSILYTGENVYIQSENIVLCWGAHNPESILHKGSCSSLSCSPFCFGSEFSLRGEMAPEELRTKLLQMKEMVSFTVHIFLRIAELSF